MWEEEIIGLLICALLGVVLKTETWKEEIIGLLICAMLGVVLVGRRRRGNERFPPGPLAWPVIGNLYLFFSNNVPVHQTIAALAKKYGPIIGLRLGRQKAVVVCNPELARQVLLTHDKVFSDRPSFEFSTTYGIDNGIAFNRYGPQWRKNRRICALHFFNAKRLQDLQYVRQEELRAILLALHNLSRGGTSAVDFKECMGHLTSHLIMRLLNASPTLQFGDENMHKLAQDAELAAAPTMGDFCPPLFFLDFFRKQRTRRIYDSLDKVCSKILMERKESASSHDDLLDALLSQEDALTAEEMKAILIDIIVAGTHTSSLTLEWAMAELLKSPHCLHRLQREIDTLLGERKEVMEADIPNLSYLNCVVKEVFRLHPPAPLLVPRLSMAKCELQGYIIPAKTLVLVNAWAIGRDEKVWTNAYEFRPERFEGLEMDVKGQHFELLPFGSGRRLCVGLPFALLLFQVTLANLVRCFDWELPDGEPSTSINMDEKGSLASNKVTPLAVIPKLRIPFPIID